jgi:hypothetical protein
MQTSSRLGSRVHSAQLLHAAFLLTFALILLASLPVAEAGIDAWYVHKSTFKYDGVLYTVKVLANYQVVRLESNVSSFSIQNNTCREEETRSFCYYGMDSNPDKMVVDEFGNLLAPVRILIKEKAATVSLSRSVTTANPLINAEFNVTVTIKNTGDLEMTDMQYDALLPPGVRYVNGYSGAGLSGGHVLWESGLLDSGKTTTFTYSLKSSEYGAKTVVPKFSYKVAGVGKTADPGSIAISVPDPFATPYGFSQSISSNSVRVGDRVTWTFTLTNQMVNESLDVDLTARIPPALTLISSPRTMNEEGVRFFRFKKTMENKSSESFTFVLGAEKTGKYSLDSTVKLVGTDPAINLEHVYTKNLSAGLAVTLPALTSGLYVNRDDISAGERIRVTLKINNPSSDTTFFNVEGTLNLGFTTVPIEPGTMIPSDEYVFERDYILPENVNTSSFSFSGVYYSQAEEKFTLAATKKVNVLNASKILLLTPKLSKTSLKRGETLSVTVAAKNSLDAALSNVFIYDASPGEMTLVSGERSGTVTLAGAQQKDAYQYQVRIPEDFEFKTFYLKTIANIPLLGENRSQSVLTKITITDPLPTAKDEPDPYAVQTVKSQTVQQNITQNQSMNATPGKGNQTQNPPVQIVPKPPAEKNFFGKLGDWIKKFFGGK